MAAPQASSRLELLQARFQQKQLQEKEQKLLQLYDQQQQRAYQVVQRGSPGSNSSSHATSISQHTVAKTSSSGHTTSTSQGGKVRQMFDERRQTTVKGIDRSYPLEPLENKPRKQANGNGVQKNGVLTVNRQSVTVKRVARADVNSNLNGGKPVVSYHEEITRESFGPSARQQQDEDEFGNENHVARYANGNHRDETHIEEVLDEDTIERNRMMAKLHLMEYDETLKHRVKNDLESEEFPEDFMVDVPDKLPKQNVTKKLSPAEARLERFKNANAKRSNSVMKNQTTVPKKRGDLIFLAKSTSSEDRTVKTGTRDASSERSNDGRKSPGSRKSKARTVSEEVEGSDSERSMKRRDDGSRFYCRESARSATTYAIDAETTKLSSVSLTDRTRRGASPVLFSRESEKSTPVREIDSNGAKGLSPRSLRNARQRSESPRFSCREGEKAAKTYAIDAKSANKLPESFRSGTRRNASPEFFCKESEKSATTYGMDSAATKKLSSVSQRNRKARDSNPKYFCVESEKSATTYAVDSRSRSTSPEFTKGTKHFEATVVSKTRYDESDNDTLKEIIGIDTIDRHIESKSKTIRKSPSPKYPRNGAKLEKKKEAKSVSKKSPNVFERLARQRSSSTQFFNREGKRSARTLSIGARDYKFASKSPVPKESHTPESNRSTRTRSSELTGKNIRKSNASPQFYASDSERSASVLMVTPETIAKPRTQSPDLKKRKQSPAPYIPESQATIANRVAVSRKLSSDESKHEGTKQFIRSSVSRFFSEQCEKASKDGNTDAGSNLQSVETSKKRHLSRGSSPLSLRDMKTPDPTRSEFHRNGTTKPGETTIDRRSSSRDSSPRSQRIVDSRGGTPEFFCYETAKSATTVSLKPPQSADSIRPPHEGSPKSIKRKPVNGAAVKSKNTANEPNLRRSSKSPDNVTTSKAAGVMNRRESGSILRSTKLIRDAIKSQNSTAKRSTRQGSSFAASGDANETTIESRRKLNRSEMEEEAKVNRKVEKRAWTPDASELPAGDYGPKSTKSAEMDTEIQEITMPNRYVKQEHLRGTYTRSSTKTAGVKSNVEQLLTYSVRRPSKQRGSLLETDVFESSTRYQRNGSDLSEGGKDDWRREMRSTSSSPSRTSEALVGGPKRQTGKGVANGTDECEVFKSTRQTASPIERKQKKIHLEGAIVDKLNEDSSSRSTVQGRWTSSPSPPDESITRAAKHRAEGNRVNRKSAIKVSRCREQTASPRLQKERKAKLNRGIGVDQSGKRRTPSPQVSKQAEILRSMELVRRAMNASNLVNEKAPRTRRETRLETSGGINCEGVIQISRSTSPSASTIIETMESHSDIVSVKEKASSAKNYERTDSVESALRRFDSIGGDSVRSTRKRSKESITEKRQTESNRAVGSRSDSKTISLKAVDRTNVDLRGCGENRPSRTSTKRTSSSSQSKEFSLKRRGGKTQAAPGQKKLAKARNSIEIARIAVRSKSPSCKRQLFQDADSEEETETGSTKSKCSLDFAKTVERSSSWSNKNETPDSAATVSTQFEFIAGNEASMREIEKGKTGNTSTGVDRSLSVKRLRSIEDIRKSIGDESSNRKAMEMSRKWAIANNATGRSEPRRINIDDRAGNRKEMPLPRRSERVVARNGALGDASRSSVKCTMRFSRVTKSPSPETKVMEPNGRVRRNVPGSPSKSPDIVVRRPSTELRAQDTKTTKRPTPMKGTEPIGNRKATTSTTTRKSTDVVDGAILENGLHLRGQTAETKNDNDSVAARKSDAFVVDFDEQPPKENDTPPPRKSLLRKQSTEKQTPSAQSVRTPLSVSSISSGSSMQGQTSGSRGKMPSKLKASVSSKSNSSKSGVNACNVDQLVPCKICGRRFAQDRVTLHEQICTKTGQKKRKQFDTLMYRVRGTELEPFVKKASATKKQPEKSKKPEVKSNWRRKHEDFINAIRSAKQVQAHLAAGGKLSDLPPPPASDNSDYIQCPHCGRKFNQAAAERHIPKCEHMLHNKPVHARLPKPRR